MSPLRVVVIDDEAPARSRLRELLGDCSMEVPTEIAGEAENGFSGLELLANIRADVALVDIQMPGMSGIEFARHARLLDGAPAVIFVTAHDQFAIDAFDVNAIDYVLKPVRASRLAAALKKVLAGPPATRVGLDRADPDPRRYLSVNERGRVTLVPVGDVLYLKAEQKYVTVKTRNREYLIEESLSRLEEEFADLFIRIHRNCLVSRRKVRGFERLAGDETEANWAVVIQDSEERLPVSRRQWPQVKALGKS